MKVMTAKVVKGQLDLPEGALKDGETVTLLVPEAEERGFRLSEEEQKEIRSAIEQAERGESVDGWQLLDQLKR